MDNKRVRKRVTLKPKHPNPLFEQWLIEWRDKAKENDSKMQYCFSQALSTLRKYPIPLESGKDCKILKGFGEKLCKMLDDKLKQHKAANGDLIVNSNHLLNSDEVKSKPIKQKPVSPQKNNSREYIPLQGSGAFAILVALYEKSLEVGYPGFLTKNQIIESGQHLCNVSFTKPGPDSRYTGWSSMRTLLEKNLINKEGNPARFSLTSDGTALADRLYIQHKIDEFQKQEEAQTLASCSKVDIHKSPVKSPAKNKPLWRHTSSTSTQSSTTYETVIFAPNSFDIILLVDTQELNGSKGDVDQDPIIMELKKLNVRHEVRNLKVGDYVWISRDSTNNELVLPYIVERKRMDDLGKSIKDDRFHEQKFRLKQCGIQNLIYLIESYGKNQHVGLPITTLYQAATNTLIHDGFTVKFTDNGKGSCEYLACLTNFLEKIFKGKTLVSCAKEDLQVTVIDDDLIQCMHFQDFNKSSSKTKHFKVKEIFVRQLLQISGMSVDKALAIVEKYATPKLLKLRYEEIGEMEGEKLLSSIQYGTLRKNIGPVLSKVVYQYFCKSTY